MKKKAGGGTPPRGQGPWLLMAASTVLAGVLAFGWYLSPVALGFADWPEDAGRRAFLLHLYAFSWRWGIPALLLAQAFALVLAWRGRWRLAELVAVLANLGFAALIGSVFSMIR